MYDLFDNVPATDQGKVILPQFIYLKGALSRDLMKVTSYYQNNVTSVGNDHLLVKLLLNLNVSMKRELQNYVDTVSDVGMQTASLLRLTTPLNYGKVFSPGPFYGKGCSEIILVHDEPFDVYAARRNWRELRPVVVHRHPFTDTSMARPTGRAVSGESGLVVVSINLPMLAVQWRGWWAEERQPDPSLAAKRTHQFVSMYPLTNMAYSHLDIAIFNRMATLYNLDEPADFTKAHPFFLVDRSDELDNFLEKQIELLRRKPLIFDQVLLNIPAITAADLSIAMRLPDVVPTRQIKWGLIIARLPLVRFLVQLNALHENHKNRWYLNRLRTALKAIRVDRVLESTLPLDVLRDIDDFIVSEIEPYL